MSPNQILLLFCRMKADVKPLSSQLADDEKQPPRRGAGGTETARVPGSPSSGGPVSTCAAQGLPIAQTRLPTCSHQQCKRSRRTQPSSYTWICSKGCEGSTLNLTKYLLIWKRGWIFVFFLYSCVSPFLYK